MFESSTPFVSNVLLQSSQNEVYQFIKNSTLLEISLWADIAIAGFCIFGFTMLSRGVHNTRSRLIFSVILMVPMVSLLSSLSLLSGLTVRFIEMPSTHPLGGQEILSLWGRQLGWLVTAPLIVFALGLLAKVDQADMFAVLSVALGMCTAGLAATLTTASYRLRWSFFMIGFLLFAVLVLGLIGRWSYRAKKAGTGRVYSLLRSLIVVIWLGYPLIWVVSPDGLALVQNISYISLGYTLLDFFSKYLIGFIIVLWVRRNDDKLSSQSSSGGGKQLK